MRNLIRDLLDVARIEAGTLSLATEPAALAALVGQARAVFLEGGAGNSIEVDLAPDLPRLAADRQRIVQVLDNLLSNAAKYSPEGSVTTVSAWREDSHVAVCVADHGRGITAQQLPRLFRKFSRLEGGDGERRVEGEGLGLAVCRGIVEAHGGRIWAESDGPGLGARFIFTVPAADEAIRDPVGGPGGFSADYGWAGRARARVLVVDDDPQILWYVRNTLAEAGYTPQRYRGPGGGGAAHPGGAAPPGAAGPGAAGHRRVRADAAHPGTDRCAGALPVGAGAGPGRGPGLRHGGRRLHR